MVLHWELRFAAPGSADLYSLARTGLGALKSQYTGTRVDWFEDKKRLAVTVQDIEVFVAVMRDVGKLLVLQDISCEFSHGPATGRVVLGPEGESEDMSTITFPTARMSK